MVVLVDTNVVMDFLVNRKPYADDAVKIVNLCRRKKVTGYLAAHTISNLFYILRKDFSISQRREMLGALCRLFEISGVDRRKVISALENEEFDDFEDCRQMECALEIGAEYIITRNCPDFSGSEIPAIEPSGFLELFETDKDF